jgi:acyl-CoA synthetase (AMP-forming)/AMP-acid ligase II
MAESTLMISGGAVNDEPVYCAIAAEALAQKQVVIVDDDAPNAKHLVSVGNTWLDTKIAIVNPETSQEVFIECEPDQVGEIWISGSSVAIGYWQNPEATKATFQAKLSDRPEHWLRTGDLGFIRNGELFVTGRLKDLLILWGRNHYPQDIELTVQNSHPSLRIDAGAAFSIEVNHQITIQESLVIVQEVERSALRNLDVDAIMSAIRQAVSEQHEISVFAIALIKPASISKTSSGKIQRQACREQFLAGSLAIVAQWTNPT